MGNGLEAFTLPEFKAVMDRSIPGSESMHFTRHRAFVDLAFESRSDGSLNDMLFPCRARSPLGGCQIM